MGKGCIVNMKWRAHGDVSILSSIKDPWREGRDANLLPKSLHFVFTKQQLIFKERCFHLSDHLPPFGFSIPASIRLNEAMQICLLFKLLFHLQSQDKIWDLPSEFHYYTHRNGFHYPICINNVKDLIWMGKSTSKQNQYFIKKKKKDLMTYQSC